MHIHRFVGSTTIDHIAFNEADATLTVTFHDSGRYVYFDVARTVYEDFRRAASPGAFLNSQIKGRFDFKYDPARRRFGPKASRL